MGSAEGWAPAVITLIGWIFTAGMTIGRINGQEKTLKNHDDRLDGHDDKLENLGNRMTASESWREGYNAGRSK